MNVFRIVLYSAMLALWAGIAAGGATPAAAAETCSDGQPRVVVNSTVSDAGYRMSGVPFCGSSVSYTDTAQNTYRLEAYQGIRYATADRWAGPTAYNYAAQTENGASNFGAACPRAGAAVIGAPIGGIGTSEDCLFLNVWRPAGTAAGANLPVMVFIHGGAFVFGASSDGVEIVHDTVVADSGTYNGKALASHGLIVVTINYRLGALGFINALFSDSGNQMVDIAPNLGLVDQQLALKWVRDNIVSMGGDPGNVTLFGESAGAMSTGFHMFSIPTSDTLFAAAIMESNPMGYPYRTKDAGQTDGQNFLTCLCEVANGTVDPAKDDKCKASSSCKIDYATLKDPKKTSTATVMAAQAAYGGDLVGEVMARHLPEGLQFSPVIDGDFVRVQPLGFGAAYPNTPKPYIFGMNKDEGALFPSLAIAAGKHISKDEYPLIMDEVFKGRSKEIRKFEPNGHAQQPYAADTAFDKKTMADPYIALSNTINDFAFRCGNFYSAVKATSDDRRTGNEPVYGYLFAPGPIPYSVMSIDNPGCAPNNADGFVCHTTELPYVFNTLTSTYAQLTKRPFNRYVPTVAEVALSEKVVAAWASFAKGGTSPRSPATADFDWKAWNADAATNMLLINAESSMVNAFGNSGCGGLPDTPLWFPILNDPPGTD